MAKTNIPRGIRNNNPLNIRFSEHNAWLGRKEYDNKTDKSFEEFTDLYYGLRAGIILLRRYIEQGCNSVERIIQRWAPMSENNTEAYIKHVCEWSGFNRQQKIRWENPNDMIALVSTMMRVECGVSGMEWKKRVAAAYVTYRTVIPATHEGRYEMILAAIESVMGGSL